MRISATVRWHIDNHAIDPRVLDILRAIAVRGSLSQATAVGGLSYRHAWALLARYEALLGRALVKRQRGRGAELTALGRQLATTTSDCDRELAPQLARWAADFNRRTRDDRDPAAVVVRASHDLALTALRDRLARSRRVHLELAFAGSLDALRALVRHQCDVAGFHLPDSPLRALLLEPFRPLLRDRALCLIHVVDRRQGLMVAPGNPHRIRDIGDLARRGVRFVNRQPGSGTRLFLDQLLAWQRVRPATITGYADEEFTHAAVAAAVASGMRDCGFGIEASARQHGLDFVPIATEQYYLALRRSALDRPGVRVLLETLRAPLFRRIVGELAGYRVSPDLDPRGTARLDEPAQDLR